MSDVCRLAVLSNVKNILKREEVNDFLLQLQISNGGHGDGFVYKKGSVVLKTKRNNLRSDEVINTFRITKIFPIDDLIEYTSVPSTFIYHTRIASTGKIALDYVHPAVDAPWLVCQNGTEYFQYKSSADFVSVANLLKDNLIKPETLLYISLSNWIIVNTEDKKIYVISAKESDLLKIYIQSDTEFIIASEPIEGFTKNWLEFHGIIRLSILNNCYHIDEIDTNILREYKPPKISKWDWNYYYKDWKK